MDCTPFIRTKTVLATWLAVPLLVLILVELTTRGYCNHQQVSCEQRETVSRMAPRMQAEATYAARFLETYQIRTGRGSVQDVHIGLLNSAVAKSGFTIETINLDQEIIDEDLGTAQIIMKMQGTGTCRQIAEFLKKVKNEDPLICEDKLAMAPSGKSPENLQVNATFIKIYVEQPRL